MARRTEVSAELAHAKIQKLGERSTQAKVLIYGDPGAGKTYLAATAPKALLLLTEPNVSDPTLHKVAADTGNAVDIWPIESWDDIVEAYEFLENGKHDYQTVILDSLTDAQLRLNEQILKEATDMRYSKGMGHDPDVLEQGDWQKVSVRLSKMVRYFRDLPMHVVMIALLSENKKGMKYGPMVQPEKFANKLAAFFNIVGVLVVKQLPDVDEPVRRLVVMPTESYDTKNPAGVLPDFVDNPNLTEIFELMKGAR